WRPWPRPPSRPRPRTPSSSRCRSCSTAWRPPSRGDARVIPAADCGWAPPSLARPVRAAVGREDARSPRGPSRSGERPMATDTAQQEASKLSLPALTAMVVGSMVGAGVFQLPARFAGETGVYGALIAWTVAGLGMLMLAFVFQTLAVRKPDLDNGVYVYARAGF